MSELQKNFVAKVEKIFAVDLKQKLPSKLAVAVSGGADSLALTLLLADFCRQKKIKIFAATIDHKMREASFDEALALGKILAKKKIPHEILSIPSKKIPKKNIEAKLRELRYELLASFCKKHKIEFLFLGHQLDDVAENFLIRLFRGSGLDGLSTMAELASCQLQAEAYEKIKLIRPLLDVAKDDLKNFLRAKKTQWFEDETNLDEKFLRNKIRKFFDSFEEKNLIQKRIKNASDEIAKMRDFFDEISSRETVEIFEKKSDGSVLLQRKKFQKLDEKIALKTLAKILMQVGKKPYKPRLEKLKRFYEYLMMEGEIKPRNFYGCMAKKFDDQRVIIFRELKK